MVAAKLWRTVKSGGRRIGGAWRQKWRDQRGGALVVFGVVAPAVIGVAGLGVDAVSWYMTKRQLQAAADMVAVMGAHVLSSTRDTAEVVAAGNAEFTKNITGRLTATTIDVQTPPQSGDNVGDANSVKAVLTYSHPLYLAGVILGANTVIRAEAVAKIVSSNSQCVLALDPTAGRAVEFSGGGNVQLGCGVMANSQDQEAFYMGGDTTLQATPISAAGDIYKGTNANLTSGMPMRPFSLPTEDPYAHLQMPVNLGGCTANNLVVHGTTTLSPGRYCNGVRFNGGSNITLQPGTYYIDGGTFSVQGGASLSGDGVTIVLTGNGANYATLDISGGADLDLTAPKVGSGADYEGILFFQDPAAPTFQGNVPIRNKLLGGADLDLRGVIYFPKQALDFTGGVSGLTRCLQIVANQVRFTGDARVDNNCAADDGVLAMLQPRIKLVE
jgi:Flp pilus assembly protein TadG